jgi:GxxExxY protein
MTLELRNRGIRHLSQVILPLFYLNKELETGLRLDLLVDEQLIVEIKAVERLLPVHEA